MWSEMRKAESHYSIQFHVFLLSDHLVGLSKSFGIKNPELCDAKYKRKQREMAQLDTGELGDQQLHWIQQMREKRRRIQLKKPPAA